jgi:hypothetical protein
VLAFYYRWYGNPNAEGGSGRWSHWNGVEPEKEQIASSTNFPSLGAYDDYDVLRLVVERVNARS